MAIPHTPSFDLTGKKALVTGGSSGIGFASAAALLQAGAKVTITGRNEKKLEDALTELVSAGYDAEGMAGDIADVASTKAMIDSLGPFDIMVNSAGLARHGPSLDTNEEDFEAVSNINLKGAYFLTQACAQKLIDAGGEPE